MKKSILVLTALALAATFTGCGTAEDVAETSSAAAAKNPFANATSTAAGQHTWDSDLISVEAVPQTGRGVYVAVLDTGLVPNWRDYFPAARVDTKLGTGFEQQVTFGQRQGDPCGLGFTVGPITQSTWVGSTGSTHGTHVASTILGYFYASNFDVDPATGAPLLPGPLMIRGIAPEVTVIPVRVLADYHIPARPNCTDPGPIPAQTAVFGTSEMIAAGLDYVTSLKRGALRNSPVVVNMSLGGPELEQVEKDALDRAIAAGVIIVASAGNDGTDGMGFPGAYAPVISVGSAGWTKEWLSADGTRRDRLWWLQSTHHPFSDIPEPTPVDQVYVSDFSSRQLAGQELDVLAPGSWVRGPFPGDPGFAHLPWWSNGIGDLRGGNPSNFFYVGGTSMASPHVASLAAMMLQKNGGLRQAQVEQILKNSALRIPAGSARVLDNTVFATFSWGDDATGRGLVQAPAALAQTP